MGCAESCGHAEVNNVLVNNSNILRNYFIEKCKFYRIFILNCIYLKNVIKSGRKYVLVIRLD